MSQIDFFELTDAGTNGAMNQDAVGHWPYSDGLLFAVADGIGEEQAGEVASGLALEVVAREMASAPEDWPILKRLRRAVQAANVEIYQKGLAVPELARMGTTLTATALVGPSLVAAHVGDCRLCLFREGRLIQLTKDHTWAWDEMSLGRLSASAAHQHPRRHELSRHLGHELIVPVDLLTMALRTGDVLAHVSDGVHQALEEDEIAELLEGHPPEAACRAIVRRAREAESIGNVSVQVARVETLPASAPRAWWRLGR
jgi:protein phosphatase